MANLAASVGHQDHRRRKAHVGTSGAACESEHDRRGTCSQSSLPVRRLTLRACHLTAPCGSQTRPQSRVLVHSLESRRRWLGPSASFTCQSMCLRSLRHNKLSLTFFSLLFRSPSPPPLPPRSLCLLSSITVYTLYHCAICPSIAFASSNV